MKISMNDIRTMVCECVRSLMAEGISSIGSIGGEQGKDVVINEYDAISFANKFYTLWRVIEMKYTTTYVFRKNISFSKEKAMALYPDAVINENLRGKSRSFTVQKLRYEGDGSRGISRIPIVSIEPGQEVDIERMMVNSVSTKTTRYGKPYTCISGEDLEKSTFYDIVINIFDRSSVKEIPHEGDIMKVVGKVGFLNKNDGTLYLNDSVFTVTSATRGNSGPLEEGTKVSEDMMIKSMQNPKFYRDSLEKDGIVTFVNENGDEFYVDCVVNGFRGGGVVEKFDMSEMNIGDKYHVSGTVKVVNGYNKLIRVKMNLIEKNDKSSHGEDREIKFISMAESYRQGKGGLSQKTYNFTEDDLPEVFEHILSIKKENGDDADLYIQGYHYNGDVTVDALMDEFTKQKERYAAEKNFSFCVSVSLRPTKECVSYALTVYFKQD